MAEATIVSRYLPWVRGSRVAEATIVSRYHPGVRGDPRGRSHYREATITPWSAATRVAEATIGKPPSPIEFEVATNIITYCPNVMITISPYLAYIFRCLPIKASQQAKIST